MANKLIKEDTQMFMIGYELISYAAIDAGAALMYGYPITLPNEIMHT